MHFGNGKLTPCRDVLDSDYAGCSDLNTTRFLERMIQLEKPDFVVFTGIKPLLHELITLCI